jgi:hypothetical protein
VVLRVVEVDLLVDLFLGVDLAHLLATNAGSRTISPEIVRSLFRSFFSIYWSKCWLAKFKTNCDIRSGTGYEMLCMWSKRTHLPYLNPGLLGLKESELTCRSR